MMKKILIALDYDPTAEKIAEEGYTLAKTMQAQVILIHVLADMVHYIPLDYSPVMGFSGMSQAGSMDPLSLEELRKGAELFLQSSKEHLGDSSIQTIITEGEFAEKILSVATEHDVSIIVVGSQSKSNFEKILMGSVTEKLLHDTMIPLFIVPTKKK